jgi:hypothetical protein
MSALEPKAILLAQARAIGLEVDGRWSIDTLAEKVEEAQILHVEKQTEDIRKSCDTWVYMIRDGFVVADEKLEAGTMAEVPEAVAERWYEAGVARPGKKPV